MTRLILYWYIFSDMENPHQCLVCGNKFKSATSLRRHLKRHADKIYECDICHKAFSRKDELQRHSAVHSKDRLNVCERCGMCFPTPSSLYNHKVIIHQLKKFKCDICDKEFVTKQNLNRHKKLHGEKEECLVCKKTFSRLKDHIPKCQNKKRLKRFTCECGKMFMEQRYLKEHQKYAHGPERYQCHKCSHLFAHRKSLIEHKQKC